MHESGPLTSVGRYALLSRLGEGGMGVVHLAEESSGRRVAVKLLRPHVVSDESGRARLAREVTSLRRVRSPRVASVYDADPWGDTPYVVTRYVQGPSLQDQVDSYGPVTGLDLDRLALGLAEALAAVHQADVLHRDIKPSNVLIEDRRPVLIDFGLAQLADDSRITHTGWLLGTPGYLAPEILFGEDPTPKADVHAWAATVVFAATGKGPYGRGPAVAVMDRVRRGEHDLTGVPDSLYWVIQQALLPDPRDRPTAEQLLTWLAGGVAVDPMTQRQPVAVAGVAYTADSNGGWARGVPTAATQAGLLSAPEQATPPYFPTRIQAAAAPASPRLAEVSRPTVSQPPVTQARVPEARFAPGTGSVSAPQPAVSMGLIWLGFLVVVMAGAVTAPILTAVGLVCLAWGLRAVSVRARRLTRWRLLRGARRSDGWVATLTLPWFALLALPGTLINAAVALGAATITVLFTTLAAPPRDLVGALAAAGLVAAVLMSWGPGGRGVRNGARVAATSAARYGLTSVLVVVLAGAGAIGLFLVREVGGAVYSPLPAPPWEQHLRSAIPDLVTRAQQGLR